MQQKSQNRARPRGRERCAAAAALTLACALLAAPAAHAAHATSGPAQAPSIEETSAADSVAVLVNPERPLDPIDYVPEDLVDVDGSGAELVSPAADAAEELLAAARQAGHDLVAESGYRSYDRQSELYRGYVAQYGASYAERISAKPGTSEHQLGLAVDVGLASGQCSLHRCFGDTAAGAWVAEHAEEFGFVLRYPDGHSETTGYAYEPWHLRYLGPEVTADFAASNAETYEEYVAALETAADVVSEPLPSFLPPEPGTTDDADPELERVRQDLSWLPHWLAEGPARR
ncbi:M15 family metallopeptidase [Zhihengliuella sp.]|uniref:M15 family metallopeptidase n=1 Tax=Zhihengliuella sp. TaxID=1954483 RepID=UPI0028125900|nr:M15 family metallopeptidase [Zhihengliuella sp.]